MWTGFQRVESLRYWSLRNLFIYDSSIKPPFKILRIDWTDLVDECCDLKNPHSYYQQKLTPHLKSRRTLVVVLRGLFGVPQTSRTKEEFLGLAYEKTPEFSIVVITCQSDLPTQLLSTREFRTFNCFWYNHSYPSLHPPLLLLPTLLVKPSPLPLTSPNKGSVKSFFSLNTSYGTLTSTSRSGQLQEEN